MSTFPLRRLRRLTWLLGLSSGLLGGCHSAHTAFSFRPAASATTVTTSPAVVTAPAAATAAAPAAVASALPATRTVRFRPHRAASVSATVARATWSPAAPRRRLAPRWATRHATARHPADDGHRPHDTFHIVLGSVLIVGSVLIGLWLGGWLGLGVGAAIMLLGDYFLVLGIGGKHAWLEIFQEFFNM